MPAPNEITAAQLARLIGTPACPQIIDICTPEDFAEEPYLIPTAQRRSHENPDAIAQEFAGQKLVIICQKGKKLSQGMASYLRAAGLDAEYLQGGAQGWRATAQTHSVAHEKLPKPVNGATLWVTRHRPKIDRIACPWLIRRFIDRNARFLFVAPAEVLNVAERFNATAFDIDGAPFHHHNDKCTFDALLSHFALKSDALDRMANIIRAADTNQLESAPQAAGLLALSIGLSRQYRDDHEQLEQGLALYDALFRWARDGHDETHEG